MPPHHHTDSWSTEDALDHLSVSRVPPPVPEAEPTRLISLPSSTKWLTLANSFCILTRMATETDIESRVAAIRRFNRSYTKMIGVLHEGFLRSPFSLTEVRVLFELAHSESPTATAIVEELGLDAGYLSRILRRVRDARPAESQALG